MTDSRSLGGYDDGYRACACFWGQRPGSLVPRLLEHIPDPAGVTVLDAACGEGKNAIYLARLVSLLTKLDRNS
jgi:tellurite methyltransferase